MPVAAIASSSDVRRSAPADVPQAGHVVQPLGDQHLGVEGIVLGEVADPPLGFASAVGQRHAVEADGAGVRLEVLGDHPHRGGLAGPVGAQEAHHLSAIHPEGDLIYGGDAVKPLGDSFEREQRHRVLWVGGSGRAGF